ncbi:MAG: ribose-phosphate pyrophosphokinase [Candidatus Kerfeldbacteria bacterium]|nr:ribose-phosphate pyrophosphokinase [Candidatus Kerfeldbacteria bacterium]
MRQNPQPLLFSGTANRSFARRVAKELNLKLGNIEVVKFSDEETHVIVHEDVVGRDVYIIQPTSMPANEHLMELLLMVHAIKSGKPKRITAVMPFFGYRRQEKQTKPGESLSFQLIAKLLRAAGVTRVLVMDLHKHRSSKFFLEEKMISKELRAFDVIIEYFRGKKLQNFVVLAPDKGAVPESERYAKALQVPLVKVFKHRVFSKRDQVTIDRFEGGVAGKDILIIDDEINTAGTLMGIVDILKKKKARNIYFACTHAVLSGPAIERLANARIRQVIVTDTIFLPQKKRLHKIRVLSVSSLFANTIARWSRL